MLISVLLKEDCAIMSAECTDTVKMGPWYC